MGTGPAELSAPTARLLDDEWVMRSPHHPNILVVAPDRVGERVVLELTRVLRHPARHWNARPARSWPLNDVGSLIVRDVAAFTSAEQMDLYRWLTQRLAERIQVLSVTTVPLFPLVERGAFLEALYYRLNVIYLSPGVEPIRLPTASRP